MPERATELISSEWGNADQIYVQFGFTRGTLYKLADAGRIKSVIIKTKSDASKGVRLFNIQSIREMLEEASVS
jgi:hypothetical protein